MPTQTSRSIPTLKNAPIVEAILDIDCDLPSVAGLATTEELGRARFTDVYPTVRKQFVQALDIKVEPDAPLNLSSDGRAVNAIQFRNRDENQLVQMRAQGYTFNRLAPYSGLDDYLPEIERTWKIYNEIASPTRIRSTRLRYINRIHVPLTAGKVELDDYLKIGPRLPDEDGLGLTSFLVQQSGFEHSTGLLVSIVLAAQPTTVDTLPVILDITVTSNSSIDPSDWLKIRECTLDLRRLKNAIFSDSLTDQCIKLFQ